MNLVSKTLALSSLLLATPNAVNALDCENGIAEGSQVTTKLTFFGSEVVTNELHLGGELRYQGVGEFEGDSIDLVVTTYEGDYSDITDVLAARGKPTPEEVNGYRNDQSGESEFGNINLQTVKGMPMSGLGNFEYCIMKTGTDEKVTLDEFEFTVYDLDQRGGGEAGIKERLFMDTSQIKNFALYPDIAGSEVTLDCEDEGVEYNDGCATGRTVFNSTTKGKGEDNPNDKDALTEQQKRRSVAFTFENTSCFRFSYDHWCPADQPGYVGSKSECRGYTGGNFLFAGESEALSSGGECITPSPTPKPTEHPTPAPPPCPEDVELIHMVGHTTVAPNDVVKIVSQDTSSVTVQLVNAWNSEDDIDAIFYDFMYDDFGEKCFSQENVAPGDNIEEITIQCYHHVPFARLEICVSDQDDLSDDDDAEVPKCCHPEVDICEWPVVCYTFTIACDSVCVEADHRFLRGH